MDGWFELPWAAAAFESELAQTPLLLFSVTGRRSGGARGRRRAGAGGLSSISGDFNDE